MTPVEPAIEAAAGRAQRITGFQRRLQRWAAAAGVSLRLAALLHVVDRLLLLLTRDRTCLTTLAIGLPVLLVRTRGARSRRRRARPVTVLTDGERLVLIASNFGRRRHPSWYHNLRADPKVEVRQGRRWRWYDARLAERTERDGFWQAAVALYPGYADYARRAAPRRIPIVVLQPLASESP